MTTIRNEPAAIIGLIGTIIVGALTTVAGSGLVSGNGLDVVSVLISIVPLVFGLITRQLVTPVAKVTTTK